MSCFMFGHGDAPETLLPTLEQAIERHYTEYGVRSFYVGNRGNFDRLAAIAARRVKQRHADLKLYLLLAYHPAERKPDLTNGFDGSYYPPLEGVPRPFTIVRANQHMADMADRIICYVWHFGNTRNLLEYAQRHGAAIENIAERQGG